MSKHTPGPWVYREYGGMCGTNIFVVERPSHEPICTLPDNRYNGFSGEANARLIAAAPDMRALLLQIHAELSHVASDDEDEESWEGHTLHRIEKLLWPEENK